MSVKSKIRRPELGNYPEYMGMSLDQLHRAAFDLIRYRAQFPDYEARKCFINEEIALLPSRGG